MRVSCVAPVRGWSAASPVLRGTWGVQRRAMAASAAQIKELRALTAAPLSDCKKALNADGVDGDMDKALDWLRKNGVATASKKAGRAAAEGVVCVKGNGEVPTTAVVVEVNSETDFVGRNSDFTSFVERIGDAALAVVDAGKDMEVRMVAPLRGGRVADALFLAPVCRRWMRALVLHMWLVKRLACVCLLVCSHCCVFSLAGQPGGAQ